MATRYYLSHPDCARPAVYWVDSDREAVAHDAQLDYAEGGPAFHTADRDLAYSLADSFNGRGYRCAVVPYQPAKKGA